MTTTTLTTIMPINPRNTELPITASLFVKNVPKIKKRVAIADKNGNKCEINAFFECSRTSKSFDTKKMIIGTINGAKNTLK